MRYEGHAVRESFLIVAMIIALLGVSAVEPTVGIRYGLWVSLIGLATGTLAATVYHWQLHRCLGARDVLPKRWWINAAVHHHHLTHADRQRTMPPFRVGIVCFLGCMLGCAAMLSGLLRVVL